MSTKIQDSCCGGVKKKKIKNQCQQLYGVCWGHRETPFALCESYKVSQNDGKEVGEESKQNKKNVGGVNLSFEHLHSLQLVLND